MPSRTILLYSKFHETGMVHLQGCKAQWEGVWQALVAARGECFKMSGVQVNALGERESMSTLGDALPLEIERCRELLDHYAALGAVGMFGHMMIRLEIEKAVKAITEGDCVAMLRAYEALKNCK